MSKIKLLILLLISNFFISCASQNNNQLHQFNINYIGGGADGYLLNSLLKSHLIAIGSYDKNSEYSIDASINHNRAFYITNTDNTSNRDRVSSTLQLKIVHRELKCDAFTFKEEVSQFYIVANANVFTSNDAALEKIKRDNTENLIKIFLSDLRKKNLNC